MAMTLLGNPKAGGEVRADGCVCIMNAARHQQLQMSANRQGPDLAALACLATSVRANAKGRERNCRPASHDSEGMLAAGLRPAVSKSVAIRLHLTCLPGSCSPGRSWG